jgi:hypothetical protein
MKKASQDCWVACSMPPLGVDSHSWMVALAEQRAELQRHKVQRLKKQIEEGTYDVSAVDVIRGIARREIPRLLRMARAGSCRRG